MGRKVQLCLQLNIHTQVSGRDIWLAPGCPPPEPQLRQLSIAVRFRKTEVKVDDGVPASYSPEKVGCRCRFRPQSSIDELTGWTSTCWSDEGVDSPLVEHSLCFLKFDVMKRNEDCSDNASRKTRQELYFSIGKYHVQQPSKASESQASVQSLSKVNRRTGQINT